MIEGLIKYAFYLGFMEEGNSVVPAGGVLPVVELQSVKKGLRTNQKRLSLK